MNVRQVAPKLGFIRFSRTDKLLLSGLKDNRNKPAMANQVFSELYKLKTDGLALFKPQALPADLENIFLAAEKLLAEDFPEYPVLFLKELKDYVKAIGLATYLAYDDAPRIVSPLVACNFMVGDLNAISQRPLFLNCNFAADEDESVQRGFFADDYDYLCGRLILLTGRVQGQPLGPLSLSLFIAHEVACIKLVEQAVQVGLTEKDLSNDDEVFFSNAYSYAFTYYILKALQSGQIKKNDYQEGDLANLEYNYGMSYLTAMKAFRQMTPEQRRRYLIISDRVRQMGFGAPFCVELINSPVPIGPVKPVSQ